MRSFSVKSSIFVVILLISCYISTLTAFQPASRNGRIIHGTTVTSSPTTSQSSSSSSSSSTISISSLHLLTKDKSDTSTVEDTTEKFGLEAGLARAAKDGDGESAKSLLKKYGIAYLATSIPLALVSFAICYGLVDNGVDVSALLAKVGIPAASDAADKAGTFAIAYAAHKAASPIRFPPTVLLTPIVAKLIGKEPSEVDESEEA